MATERTDITIQGNIATWQFKLDGNISGTYSGTFKFKTYLTPLEKIAANREYRNLLGANPAFAPEHESFLAYALSQLKYRVVESPPFWLTAKNDLFDGNIADDSILSAVLEAAVDSEIIYKDQLAEKQKESLQKAIKAAEHLSKTPDDTEQENGQD